MVKDYRLITTSTTHFSSRWFMSEVLHARPPTVRMTLDDNVKVICARNFFRGGRNQSGPRGTARPSSKKNMQNHRKPWVAPLVVGLTTVVNSVHIEELRVMYKHVQPCPCHSYWATRVGWTRFAKRIVTMVTTVTLVTLEKQGPSWYILMPLEVELIWTSENHSQKGVLKCTCALEVSKHWNDHWCHWCRFAKHVDKQLRAS